MRESAGELAAFEQLLARSIERAGPFIRESLEMPSKSLTAGQVLTYWDKLHTAAVAHVTARGEPRVAPTGVLLLRGHFAVPTVAAAARTKAMARHPALSISRFDDSDLVIIAHGHCGTIAEGEPQFDELAEMHRSLGNGRDVRDWGGEGVYLWMAPETLYTFARYPDQFPGSDHSPLP